MSDEPAREIEPRMKPLPHPLSICGFLISLKPSRVQTTNDKLFLATSMVQNLSRDAIRLSQQTCNLCPACKEKQSYLCDRDKCES